MTASAKKAEAAKPASEKVTVIYLVNAHKRKIGQRKSVDLQTAANLVRSGIVRLPE